MRLEYFVTGSVAAMHYSTPRLTTDVDLVLELPSWNVAEFCAVFPLPEFYVDPPAAMRAATSGGQFNILHMEQGVKADVMCFADAPFDNSRLSRRRRVELLPGLFAYVSSPEDIILKKLDFYRQGGSYKHLSDIGNMFRVSGEVIDRGYIDHWALRLGVTREWKQMQERLRQVLPPDSTPPQA
jgi:hypothetical protein